MKTRIFLVRHGATVLSVEDRFAGATNVELSDLGREQAKALSHRLQDQPITAFYASPLDRTMETAGILAGLHGKEVRPEPGFLEINHGVWEGLTREDAETKFGGMYERWEEDPFNFAPEGGETGLAVTARAMPALLGIMARHPGEIVCDAFEGCGGMGDYNVNVILSGQLTAVPIPAAVWLFGSALAGLGWMRRINN